jgi:hypothetical protein
VRRYVPIQVQQEGAFTPRELVGYTRVECGDDIGEQRRLVSIAAVPAEIALLDGDRDDLMYVAAGRCVDAEGWDAFAACLVERLTFGDRWYSRTELDEVDRGRELGPGVVYTGFESRPVDVAALVGIAPERALVSAGEPRVVWIADGSCYEGVPEDREACLRNGAG